MTIKLFLSRVLKYLLDSALVKNFAVQAILKSISASTGFLGWLAGIFVNKAFELARKLIRRKVVETEAAEESKQELKEYDKKINKPGATAEEIKDAGKEFLEG